MENVAIKGRGGNDVYSTRDADMSHFFAHTLKVRVAGASAIQVRPLGLPYVQSWLFPPVALYSPDPLDVLYTKMLRVHVIEASSLALKATATAATPHFRRKNSVRQSFQNFRASFCLLNISGTVILSILFVVADTVTNHPGFIPSIHFILVRLSFNFSFLLIILIVL